MPGLTLPPFMHPHPEPVEGRGCKTPYFDRLSMRSRSRKHCHHPPWDARIRFAHDGVGIRQPAL